MNILITVCARGGSKGVKNKNIRLLKGKPLIAHTIEQAAAWGRGQQIIVSTDSPEIANAAEECGAKVPFLRPGNLAQDSTPKVDALRHALIQCEAIYSVKYDVIVDLDATAPLRQARDIENCYQIFLEKNPKTLFSVLPARRNPYFNMVEVQRDGYARLSKALPQGIVRRQDAPQVYDLNASIYFYRRDFLLDENQHTPFSDESVVYVMDESTAFDIDSEFDFQIVEFLMSREAYSK